MLLRRARQRHARAVQTFCAGDYRAADADHARATALLRRLPGVDRAELADALIAHAETRHALGDPRGALRAAHEARSLVARRRGDANCSARSRALGTLGNVHRALGDYRAAAPLLRSALATARAVGRDSRLAAAAMNNLGILYKYTGDFARADGLYRRALRITLRDCGANHPDVASLYHNLGGLAYSRARYAAAERWGRAALALRRRRLGPTSVRVAADAAALAASLDGLGRHAEAQRLHREALRVFRARLGASHYELAVSLNNLGASLHAEGKLVAAAEQYRRALVIKRRLLGTMHVDVALTANNLGLLYLKQRRDRLAVHYVAQARAILLYRLGPGHPRTRAVLANWRKLQTLTSRPRRT